MTSTNDKSASGPAPATSRPLTRLNFLLMAAAGAVIVLGFLLMAGKGSADGQFNPDIFSTRRVVVGPTIAFIGYILMGVGIMWRRKSDSNTPAES